MDYFEQLGLSRDATTIDIKKAYRKLANKYHPDKNSGSEVEEKFQAIQTAYEAILDPKKRNLYLKSNYTIIPDPRVVADAFWHNALS